MKLILAALAAFILTGCSTLAPVVSKGAELNDDAIEGAKTTICKAASVGSVERAFNTPELKEARKAICNMKTSAIE